MSHPTPAELQEASFIKPLPCTKCTATANVEPPRARSSSLSLKNNLHDLMRPLILDSPPPGRRVHHEQQQQLSRAVQTEPYYAQANPVILLTESKAGRPGTDSMPKIEEREDVESDEEEEERRQAELRVPNQMRLRRNSQ